MPIQHHLKLSNIYRFQGWVVGRVSLGEKKIWQIEVYGVVLEVPFFFIDCYQQLQPFFILLNIWIDFVDIIFIPFFPFLSLNQIELERSRSGVTNKKRSRAEYESRIDKDGRRDRPQPSPPSHSPSLSPPHTSSSATTTTHQSQLKLPSSGRTSVALTFVILKQSCLFLRWNRFRYSDGINDASSTGFPGT